MAFNLKEYLKKGRPTLSDISINTYVQSINRIRKKLDLDSSLTNISFLSKFDDVVKVLEDYAPTTRKNMLNAIIVAMKCDGADKSTCKKYGELRDNYNADYENEQSTGKKSKKQEENWVEWPKFKKMVMHFTKEIRRARIRQRADLTLDERRLFGDYVLMRLYQDYPIRNDYHDVSVVGSKAKMNDDTNYLVKTKNKMALHLNQYKTKKAYCKKVIELNMPLVALLRDYLKINTTGWLIINEKSGEPLNSVGNTRRLNRITRDRIGKKIGSNMIRHIYLSNKYAEDVEEMKKDSESMGHSVDTQKKYIKGDA